MDFRKSIASAASLLVFSFLAASCGAVKDKDDSSSNVVTTQNGQVQGKMVSPEVRAFLGIPFAAPPVRDLRWREPQPVSNWDGIYHADRFGPQCMTIRRGVLTNQYSGAEVMSEDCLYLNVWAKPEAKKAPVVVYIHGGGFFIGSGSMPLYGGETVAEHDAVFVNLNYRLGPLGFLAHPELSSESPNRSSGNYGLLDQVAALRWIRDNIEQFGGDPSNVTIVGQSAGSRAVLLLQSSPLAKGLFHRVVGMSGAMFKSAGYASLVVLTDAEQVGLELQEMWNAKDLAEMRALPVDRLKVPFPGGPRVGPIKDGYFMPDISDNIFASSEQSDVPLMLGFTRDESPGFGKGLGAVTGLESYKQGAVDAYGDRAAEFLKLYPASNDEQAIAQTKAASRDSTMVVAMDAWARAQAQYGDAPVYSFMFARPHSYLESATITDIDKATAGAYHTSEVPFWLGTLESFNRFRQTRDWTEDDRALSKAMTESLVAFARTGVPNTDKLNWVPFDPAGPMLLKLGSEAQLAPWPDESKLEFFRVP